MNMEMTNDELLAQVHELKERVEELERELEEERLQNCLLEGDSADAVIDRHEAERLIDIVLEKAQEAGSTILGNSRHNVMTVVEALEHGFLRIIKT